MKTKHNSTLSAADAKARDFAQYYSIPRQWSALALGGFFFTSIFALLSPSVEAQCPQGWDISGQWGLKQSNQTAPNSLTLGASSSGSASYPGMTGSVSGKVAGNKVHLEISWKNGLTGIYDGTIGPQWKIEGTGYEKRSPSVKVTWYSDRAMRCLPIRPGQFVIVKCLNRSWGFPPEKGSLILEDVSIGKKYEVERLASGGMLQIRTPEGKRKWHLVSPKCVELAP